MPTYEYYCDSCGKRFDVFQGMGDEPKKSCPACGQNVRRLISGGSGFIMKGRNDFQMPSCAGGCSCAASGSCGMQGEGDCCM